jgi:pSer/pThr/pTyr-binding forkhead associated (FHA) protein
MTKTGADKSAGKAGPQGTMVFRAADVPAAQDAGDAQVNAAGSRSHLLGVTDPVKDMRIALRRGRTLVGRRENNDIVISEPSVSSLHAWIISDNGVSRVMNMLSTNGTFVNDQKVHEATLVHGDRLRFGNVEFIFQMGEGRHSGGGSTRSRNRRLLVVGIAVALAALVAWIALRGG